MKRYSLSFLLLLLMTIAGVATARAEHKPFVNKPVFGTQKTMHKTPQADAVLNGKLFGFLDGTDGMMWHFVQENVADGYNYRKSVVTVYDAKNVQLGSFTVDVPAGMRVNQIEPFGLVTSKLFDTNSMSKEVVVYLHEVGSEANNYKGTDHLYVYSIGGGKVAEFVGDGMVVDASPNEWTTWQRFIVSHDNADGVHTDIDIYRAPSWGEDSAVLAKTIQVDTHCIEYTDGAFVNFFKVAGNPYTVVCHYDKSFVEYDENGNQVLDMDTYMPYFTANNSFILDVYDKNYSLVSSTKIPIVVSTDRYMVRMNSFGVLSDNDLSKGFFTGDDQFNFIIMNEDVTLTTDYVTSFDVYDQNGKRVRTIAEEVGGNYKRLSDINGKEEQWLFLDVYGASLYAVDLPSCTRTELPIMVDEYSISFNIDRVPADNEAGLQYIMGVNEAATDETGKNVIAKFAYLNADFTPDHYVNINLGPLAQTFTPLVNNEGLDPYLFNTDDKREFLFFSKVRDSENGDTEGHNVLFIANEDGVILETFNLEAGNEKGDIWTAMIMNYGTDNVALFVNYYDWDNDTNSMEFFNLPLVKFAAGGNGTADSPYLISSVGDLAQISKAPSANYRLACDFDAHGRSVALNEFSGVLDGNGKTISNLDLTSTNDYGGLFGNTVGAKISNLTLLNPTATIKDDNLQFGLLSGFAINTKISNVTVKNATIDGTQAYATPVGVLVGMASSESVIEDCYIVDSRLTTRSRSVGGVAGEMRTGATITRTAVSGTSIDAGGEVGLVTGIVGNGCVVSDCSVSGSEVKGNNFVGGVAGRCGVSSARGTIERCIVSATINCPTVGSDADVATYSVGGVAGYVEPDWQKEGKGSIAGNVLYESSLVTSNGERYDAPCLRIAGATISNEDPERTETCLANNYQKPFDVEGLNDASEYADASSVYGQVLDATSAPALDFWQTIGYKFDGDVDAPWTLLEASRPYLYFENEVTSEDDGFIALHEGDNNIAPMKSGDNPVWYKFTIPAQKRGTLTFTGYPTLQAYVGKDHAIELGIGNPVDYINNSDSEVTVYIQLSSTNSEELVATLVYSAPIADLTFFNQPVFSVAEGGSLPQGTPITITFPNRVGGADSDEVTVGYYIFNVVGSAATGAPVNLGGNTEAVGTLAGVDINYDFAKGRKYQVRIQSIHCGNHYAPSASEPQITGSEVIFTVVSGETGIEIVDVQNGGVSSPIFNLAGQRVTAGYKGVTIQNGKKHVNK